eukprot:188711-Alexandrium_andersonii.AAC.1
MCKLGAQAKCASQVCKPSAQAKCASYVCKLGVQAKCVVAASVLRGWVARQAKCCNLSARAERCKLN